jgi:uncharacterized protein YbjT (DUF2867 family)
LNVAITAASGQLGSEIASAALALLPSANVIGLARTPENARHLGVEIRPGDYDQRGDLEESLESVGAVLLVSGMDAPDKRIEQHRNVIDAARSAGVRRIVYTSVQGAEEDTAFSPIIQSNRQTEEDVRHSGLEWVIGRNGIYIDPTSSTSTTTWKPAASPTASMMVGVAIRLGRSWPTHMRGCSPTTGTTATPTTCMATPSRRMSWRTTSAVRSARI